MDLDEFQKVVTLMSSKDLQKERAGLNDSTPDVTARV